VSLDFYESRRGVVFDICGCLRVPLYDVVYGQYGKRKSSHIYSIFDGAQCLYVGKTIDGVHNRVRAHISKGSDIGKYICNQLPYIRSIIIEVAEIKMGTYKTVSGVGYALSVAEVYYIAKYNPLFNVQCNAHNPNRVRYLDTHGIIEQT
jgi:hypothetical protein